MRPDQLLHEWLALPDVGRVGRKILGDLGVTRDAIHRAGGLARARIQVIGRTWRPDLVGFPAVVMPVWDGAAPSIFEAVEHPLLIDMIAWRPSESWRWFYRVGARRAVLGADHLDLAHTEGWPITLESTPLEWLQADCRGAVLLDDVEEVLAA